MPAICKMLCPGDVLAGRVLSLCISQLVICNNSCGCLGRCWATRPSVRYTMCMAGKAWRQAWRLCPGHEALMCESSGNASRRKRCGLH